MTMQPGLVLMRGRGCAASAQVMLAESRHSGQMYAVKIIKKAYTLENDEVDTCVVTGVNGSHRHYPVQRACVCGCLQGLY
jgi:hypothetical protein